MGPQDIVLEWMPLENDPWGRWYSEKLTYAAVVEFLQPF